MEQFNDAMMNENVWFDRMKYEQERENYQQIVSGNPGTCMTAATVTTPDSGSSLVDQIAQARANIKQSFKDAPAAESPRANNDNKMVERIQQRKKNESKDKNTQHQNKQQNKDASDLTKLVISYSYQACYLIFCTHQGYSQAHKENTKVERKQEKKKSESKDKNKQHQNKQQKEDASVSVSSESLKTLEKENNDLKKLVADLATRLATLEVRVITMESSAPAPAPVTVIKPAAPPAQKDDSDDDMFGSDDDDDDDEEETLAEKAKREKMEKMKADAAKPKKVVIAKSEVTLDVKPWDDETCMKELERLVRTIAMEGLVWGSSKLEPVGYGIFKLRIRCVVVDDLVSTDDIEDQIIGFGDHVQSMDIFAFNKI